MCSCIKGSKRPSFVLNNILAHCAKLKARRDGNNHWNLLRTSTVQNRFRLVYLLSTDFSAFTFILNPAFIATPYCYITKTCTIDLVLLILQV